MFDQARSLESAACSSELYTATPSSFNAAALPADNVLPDCDPAVNLLHLLQHLVSKDRSASSVATIGILATSAPRDATCSPAEVPQSLAKSTTTVSVDGFEAKALVDSGSSESFIHPGLEKSTALQVYPSSGTISMATSSLATNMSSYCLVDLLFGGRTYPQVRLSVLPGLCADLILGLDFQTQHERFAF